MAPNQSNIHAWISTNRPAMDEANNHAAVIGEHNSQYESLTTPGAIGSIAIMELGVTHLQQIDEALRRNLSEMVQPIPYEELGERSLQVAAKLSTVLSLIEKTENSSPELAQALKDKAYVEKVVPSATVEIDMYIDKLRSGLYANPRFERLQSKKARLEAEQEIIGQFIEEVGQAWPLPVFLTQQTAKDESAENDQAVTNSEDDEVNSIAIPESKAVDYVSNSNIRLARGLENNLGKAFTINELADLVYDSSESKYRFRIHSLFNNYKSGLSTTLGEELDKLKLDTVLFIEKGKRVKYDASGKQVGKAAVVYRAMREDDISMTQIKIDLDNGESYIDGDWVRFEPIVKSEPSDNVVTPVAKRSASPTELINDSAVAIDHTAETTVSEEVLEESETVVSNMQESKPEPEWKIELRTVVSCVINDLEKNGLLENERIKWRLVGLKTDSSIMGTQAMLDRAVSNRIISRNEVTDVEDEIEIYKVVCMAIQNNHPNIFNTRRKSREALQTVKEIIDNYFANKEV